MPAPQLAVVAHRVPQEPQLFGSVFSSTQLVVVPTPHNVCVVGHAHALFTHAAPAPQWMPHPPQLSGSLVVYTHAAVGPVPQNRSVPGQMHMPP